LLVIFIYIPTMFNFILFQYAGLTPVLTGERKKERKNESVEAEGLLGI